MVGFLTPQGDVDDDCCCNGISPESCTCTLLYESCVLYWWCHGNKLCGTRLKHDGVIISESVYGDIYNPPAGTYTLEKCCTTGYTSTWSVVKSVTVVEGSCAECDCLLLKNRGVHSVSIALPDAFSIFNGTYAFSVPAECAVEEEFTFPIPPSYTFDDVDLWTGSCDSSGFDAWAAANGLTVDVFTFVVPGVATFDYRHYYWPVSVEIGGTVGGLANYPPGTPGLLTADGVLLRKNTDTGVCSGPFLAGFSAYFSNMTGLPTYPYCTLRPYRLYAMNVTSSAETARNSRVNGCHLNLAKLASVGVG